MDRSTPLPTSTATTKNERIASLDVIRGVALLGILLLNIVGMGMLSTAYFDPLGGVVGGAPSWLDRQVWLVNELFFEGAMRALFSMLFGAGVVLFATKKSAVLHYRRTFWLLVIGLIDGFLLLWSGDILVVYAVAGALLYFARDASVRRLLFSAAALLVVLVLIRGTSYWGLEFTRSAYDRVVAAESVGQTAEAEDQELAVAWSEFVSEARLTVEKQSDELNQRRSSYVSAFSWNAEVFIEQVLFALPVFILWDALSMMLVGMALYKAGVFQGEKPLRFYQRMALAGISTGVLVNGFELYRSHQSSFDVLVSFSYLQPTYDLGRTALCLGYMALIVWWTKTSCLAVLQERLAAVGRMALTNYITHSLVAMFLFTGAGFALVGTLARWELYPVVLVIWLGQLWFSARWLERHSQGPLEAVWRKLTYG